MEKKGFISYLLVSLLLFALLNFPRAKELFIKGKIASFIGSHKKINESELELLSLENLLLRDEINQIRSQLRYEPKEFKAIQAKVILREPLSFGSFMWVDRGLVDNERLEAKVIAKNSPVVLGNAVIGVVEEVQEKRSLIRLITDEKLMVSVRAIRHGAQDELLFSKIEDLKNQLQYREDLFESPIFKANLFEDLEELQKALPKERGIFLAKGVIFGHSDPEWKRRSLVLKGVGFNYDFKDEEGGPYDLRSGTHLSFSLLQPGDLLVTTGLDGVFPANLHVGTVVEIDSLKEGAYAFSLKAIPAVANLDDLDHVQILEPIY